MINGENLMLKRQGGFTLIELMITVAVIGILAAIAFPSYQDSVRKSRRTDGKNALTQAVANMERYYTENNTYATANICGSTPLICPGSCSGVICTSTERNYLITLPTVDLGVSKALSATTFTILAKPVVGGSQALDGMLSIDEKNQRQQDTNLNNIFDTTENFWK
jgi:type IV pilus assembly protein PilE